MNAASDSVNEIATVRIELRHTDPLIWREVEVPTSITLMVLQISSRPSWAGSIIISGSLTSTDENTVWQWMRTGAARLVALQATCGFVMS